MSNYFTRLSLLALLPLTTCRPTSLSAEEYQQYIRNPVHGLQQQQQVGENEIKVTYQPLELLAAHELSALHAISSQVDSIRKQYGGTAYFLLSISHNGHSILQPQEGFAHYSSLLQTLAFQMDNHIRLVTTQGDTLRPVNCYLDRVTPNTSATQLLVAFPQPALAGIWHLQLQEYGLGTGPLTFSFNTHQLREVPKLKL